MTSRRRFPPPWTVDETNNACFIVRDKNGRALEFFGGSVGAFAAVLPDEISDPPHYCIDDRQHRDHAPHRQQPSIATTSQSLIAVATEHPVDNGTVFSKQELTGKSGEELQNESDPKRPEIFDDWQHQ